jgi:hypothetical protein
MKWTLASLVLLLSGAFGSSREMPVDQDSRAYVDAFGTVHATRASPRGGAFMKAPGNPGFLINVRNWDTTQPLVSITGFVGFSPNSTTRVVSVKARTVAADGREDPRLPIGEASVDERGMIHVENFALQPAEAIALYVTLSATPTGAYGFSFEARY